MNECDNCGQQLTSRDLMFVRCPYCDEILDEDPSASYTGEDINSYYL